MSKYLKGDPVTREEARRSSETAGRLEASEHEGEAMTSVQTSEFAREPVVGARVEHAKLGLGDVTDVDTHARVVTIRFGADPVERTMHIDYAPLRWL